MSHSIHHTRKYPILVPSFVVNPGHSSAFEGLEAPAVRNPSQPHLGAASQPSAKLQGKGAESRPRLKAENKTQKKKKNKKVGFNILISHIFPGHCLEHMNQIHRFHPVPDHKLAEMFSTGGDQNAARAHILLVTFLLRLRI